MHSVKIIVRPLIQTRKLLLNEIFIIHIDHGSNWVDTVEKAIETINQRPPTTAIISQNRVSIAGEMSGCHSESRGLKK